MRPHQWGKNAVVAAPLFFTPSALSAGNLLAVAGVVVAFSALTSAVYILNDCLDREADRRHPVKRARPLAAGEVPVPAAFALLAALLVGGMALALRLPMRSDMACRLDVRGERRP